MIDTSKLQDDLYVIFDENDRLFFTGYKSTDGILLLGKTSKLLIDARYYSAGKEQVYKNIEVVLYSGEETFNNELKKFSGNIYVDYKKCTAENFMAIKKVTKKTPKDLKDFIEKLRAIKDEREISIIKRASDITERVYLEAIRELKEGVTEKYIADFIKRKYIEYGGEEAFETIVAFSKNSAVPHHESNNTILKKDSVVLIDMGAKIDGYCSDFTRTIWYGNKDSIDKDFILDYFLVLKAHNRSVKKITSNVSVKRADSYARNVFIKENKGEYFTHSLGHGVGLDIHEYPYLSPKRKGKVEDKMVFTIEPGLYFDDKYGIRIEETYYLNNGQAERFFYEDRYLTVVEPNGEIKKIIRTK